MEQRRRASNAHFTLCVHLQCKQEDFNIQQINLTFLNVFLKLHQLGAISDAVR